jgi:hypothetical protein
MRNLFKELSERAYGQRRLLQDGSKVSNDGPPPNPTEV